VKILGSQSWYTHKGADVSMDNRTILPDLYERREKARRDIAAEKKWAVKQGMMDVARNLLNIGDSIDKIITVTGLTHEEVENLRTNL